MVEDITLELGSIVIWSFYSSGDGLDCIAFIGEVSSKISPISSSIQLVFFEELIIRQSEIKLDSSNYMLHCFQTQINA